MSIVITAPTGNVGAAVTRSLLDAGEKPVLIARDPAKVKEFTDRGATVEQGSHSDADLLTEATRGAKALFVLTPGDMQMTDVRAHYRTFAEAAATAVQANSIPHVVHLSSAGAELENGTGPVTGLYVAEQILDQAGIANLTHLRAAYFMENTMLQIPAVLQANSLFTTFPQGTRFPMVATSDIGARAATLLSKRDWTGTQVVELHGAGEVSYEEVAACLSEVLGRKLSHVTIPSEQLVASLTGMGFSPVLADLFVEMSDALSEGRMAFHEQANEHNTTPTTYPEFAQQVYKPVFEAASAG
jgi:uncharacterized protein YbjT (DUF2867 family)